MTRSRRSIVLAHLEAGMTALAVEDRRDRALDRSHVWVFDDSGDCVADRHAPIVCGACGATATRCYFEESEPPSIEARLSCPAAVGLDEFEVAQ